MRGAKFLGAVLAALLASGCVTTMQKTAPETTQQVVLPSVSGPLQCVPYARMASGIPIRGNAWTWWRQAAGRFARGDDPEVGSVLVLSKTRKLRYGHLAVVTRVKGPREIVVAHANWGWNRQTRRKIREAMPVIDISPNNDWSELRFFNEETASFGRMYPAYGFIYPKTIDGIALDPTRFLPAIDRQQLAEKKR